MTIYFTADQHLGHANILKYEADYRKDHAGVTFRTVNHMDDAIVALWNATVDVDDTVYAVGDFSQKIAAASEYLSRLNGRIILIVGNHDPFFELCKTGREAEARELAINAGFADMHMQHVIEIEGIGPVKLSHFPYLPPKPEDEQRPRYMELRPEPTGEALLLHGHIHSQWTTRTYPKFPPMLNVGVDMHGMKPISETDLIALLSSAPVSL